MKENITINVATEFSSTPGARYIEDGPFSGEEFLTKFLEPKFLEAQKNSKKLIVVLDDLWGHPSSFISGSFGVLSEKYGAATVLAHLKPECSDNPMLVDRIIREIKEPNSKPKIN